MREMLMVLVILAVGALGSSAHVYTVDCEGGGDFTDLPFAMQWATSDDTLLVAPCVYEVYPANPPYIPGYPIHLNENSPVIMSSDGPEVTIIEGDGTLSAFETYDYDYCRASLYGLTFRNLDWPIEIVGGTVTGRWRIHGNVVEDCNHGLVAMYGGGWITANVIRNIPDDGLRLLYFNGPVSGNEVAYCVHGIIGITGEAGLVSGNYSHHNSGRGISLGIYTRATDNVVEHNAVGIGAGCVGTSFNDFHGNVVRYNGVGFLQLYDAPANLHGNDLCGNTEYDFAVDVEYLGWDIDATGNWWGTTDPYEIAAGILDRLDDPNLAAEVVFDPWCDVPGCDSGTPVESMSWGTLKALYR